MKRIIITESALRGWEIKRLSLHTLLAKGDIILIPNALRSSVEDFIANQSNVLSRKINKMAVFELKPYFFG
jgi:hypothetical protein